MSNKLTLNIVTTGSAALLIGGTFLPTPVFAANSDATVKFQSNTQPVAPVDPQNPDGAFIPDIPGTGENGPLSIDYVSNLDFGTQSITTKDRVYNASLTTGKDATGAVVSRPNFVQVTDNTGLSLGWTLSVKQVSQMASAGNQLKGAELSLANLSAVTNSGSNAVAPTVSAAFTLIPGTATKVTNANANQGEGTWVTRFGKDSDEGSRSVKLSVPGASVKKASTYSSTLEWTLSQIPNSINAN